MGWKTKRPRTDRPEVSQSFVGAAPSYWGSLAVTMLSESLWRKHLNRVMCRIAAQVSHDLAKRHRGEYRNHRQQNQDLKFSHRHDSQGV